jgi:hypothetical protein
MVLCDRVLVAFEAFRRTEFQNLLQPLENKSLTFYIQFESCEGLSFLIFFNHGEKIILLFE